MSRKYELLFCFYPIKLIILQQVMMNRGYHILNFRVIPETHLCLTWHFWTTIRICSFVCCFVFIVYVCHSKLTSILMYFNDFSSFEFQFVSLFYRPPSYFTLAPAFMLFTFLFTLGTVYSLFLSTCSCISWIKWAKKINVTLWHKADVNLTEKTKCYDRNNPLESLCGSLLGGCAGFGWM